MVETIIREAGVVVDIIQIVVPVLVDMVIQVIILILEYMEIWVTILIQVHSIINLSLKEDKVNPIGQFAKFVVKMVI